MKNQIWVVEMKGRGRWRPTVGTGLDRASGIVEKRQWKDRSPRDEFRLTKYTAAAQGKRGPR